MKFKPAKQTEIAITARRVNLLKCLPAHEIYDMVKRHKILVDWPNSLWPCRAALAAQWTPEIQSDAFARLKAHMGEQ